VSRKRKLTLLAAIVLVLAIVLLILLWPGAPPATAHPTNRAHRA